MNVTLDEYVEIARLAKVTHKHLLKLIDKVDGKLPGEVIKPLLKMQDYLFLFKDKAEKQMIKDCPEVLNINPDGQFIYTNYPDYTHIFYGGFKDINNNNNI